MDELHSCGILKEILPPGTMAQQVAWYPIIAHLDKQWRVTLKGQMVVSPSEMSCRPNRRPIQRQRRQL